MTDRLYSRREACNYVAGAVAASTLAPARLMAGKSAFKFRYILASCMYGKTKLAEILPEVRKIGADHIDIWPLRHGDQREQIETIGHDKFSALLEKHNVRLGIFTRYDQIGRAHV